MTLSSLQYRSSNSFRLTIYRSSFLVASDFTSSTVKIPSWRYEKSATYSTALSYRHRYRHGSISRNLGCIFRSVISPFSSILCSSLHRNASFLLSWTCPCRHSRLLALYLLFLMLFASPQKNRLTSGEEMVYNKSVISVPSEDMWIDEMS